jgi:hypothetical protein
MSLSLIELHSESVVTNSDTLPSDESSAVVKIFEIHEEFIERLEKGSSKIRWLSIVTILVSALLFFSYVAQLSLPYVTGETVQTVNLSDPALQGVEIVVAALAFLWLYVGIDDFLFTRRLERSIREIRALEKDFERRVGASGPLKAK